MTFTRLRARSRSIGAILFAMLLPGLFLLCPLRGADPKDAAAAAAVEEPLPENLSGTYRGVYFYGSGNPAMEGKFVKFHLELTQKAGDTHFTGTIDEEYSGFGTPRDNRLWATIEGDVSSADGTLKIRFLKTYRDFEQLSLDYNGTYDAARKSFDGTWTFAGNPLGGTFTMQFSAVR